MLFVMKTLEDERYVVTKAYNKFAVLESIIRYYVSVISIHIDSTNSTIVSSAYVVT